MAVQNNELYYGPSKYNKPFP